MESHVRRSHSKLYSMHQQHQVKILVQLERLLDSVCAGPLPVADRLELRWLLDGLCHASSVTDILELAVSSQQKTTIQTDSGIGRVFMVAGQDLSRR